MSIYAIAWAKQQRTGSAAKKALLLTLADYADEQGSCWPSQERLAEETEQSVRTVRSQLHDLAALGLLRTQAGPGSANGGRKTNRYFLAIGEPANLAGSNSPPNAGVTGKIRGGLPAKSEGGYRQLVAAEPSVEPPVEPPVEKKADRSAPAALFPVEAPLKATPPKPDPVNVAAKEAADYWHKLKNGLANFHSARAVAKAALLAGHHLSLILKAMDALHAANVPLGSGTLDTEIRGGIGSGRAQAKPGGHRPYQDEDYWSEETS